MHEQLFTEALRKLNCYIGSGLAGFAQQAHDRLIAAGIDEHWLTPARDWTPEYASQLHDELTWDATDTAALAPDEDSELVGELLPETAA